MVLMLVWNCVPLSCLMLFWLLFVFWSPWFAQKSADQFFALYSLIGKDEYATCTRETPTQFKLRSGLATHFANVYQVSLLFIQGVTRSETFQGISLLLSLPIPLMKRKKCKLFAHLSNHGVLSTDLREAWSVSTCSSKNEDRNKRKLMQ